MVTTQIDTIGSFRRNLLLRSSEFDNATWTKTNVSVTANASGITAPDGTETADLLDDSSGAAYGDARQSVTGSSLTHNAVHSGSVHLRESDATSSRVLLQTADGSISTSVTVAWSSGVPTISATGSNGSGVHTYAVRPLARDANWYRIELQVTYDNTVGGGNEDLQLIIQPDRESTASTNGVYAWGAQLEERATASVYQPQGSADIYTGTYATITAWASATNNPIADDKVYVGALLDGEHVYDADVLEFTAAGNTDATRYRKLTWDATNGNRYVPHTHVGPKVYIQWVDNTSAQEGLRVTEDFFQIEGVGVIAEDPRESTGASSVTRAVLRVEGDDFLANACLFRASESSNADTSPTDHFIYCAHVNGTGVGTEAVDARFFNCVFMGGRDGAGASVGILFDSYSQDGGCYNCTAFDVTRGGGDGFFSNAASAAVGPEVVNCIAINCTNNCIRGAFWGRVGYNLTSDATAEVSYGAGVTTYRKTAAGTEDPTPGNGGVDEFSYGQVDSSQMLRPSAQDFRPLAQAIAFGAGRNESTLFTTHLGAFEDYLGTVRSTSSPSMGAFEDSAASTSRATEYVELIGAATEGRHFANPVDWELATRGVSLRNVGEIRIGEMKRDGGSSYDIGSTGLRVSRTVTDSGFYRHLRAGSDWRWNPTEKVGAHIEGDASDDQPALFDAAEDWFRATGFALTNDSASSGTRYAVRVTGREVRLDSLSMRYATGSPATSAVCRVRGERFLGVNLLALGHTTNGAQYGFRISDCTLAKLFHSVAAGIGQGSAVGFSQGSNTSRLRISGCVAAFCDTDYAGVNLTGVVDFSISEDTTLDGFPGCQISTASSTVFEAVGTEDFRLPASSPAINAGANLGPWFSSDFNGTQRLAPFDIGIFEGIGSAAVPIGPAPPRGKFCIREARLVEIIRRDGTGFHFTDASHPIVYKGRTYKPQDGVDASARRTESSLGESSVEYRGLVSDSSIKDEDLLAGLFRDAIVTERTVDWRYPWAEAVDTVTYWLGPTTFSSEQFRCDALGISHFLEQPVGEVQSVSCPVKLGSEWCGYDISQETYDDIRVSTLGTDTRRSFYANTTDLGTHPDGWFENGEILWLTGNNTSTVSVVKRFDTGGLIVLVQELGYPVKVTDTFQIVVGCKKRYVEDCVNKFSNGVNFQGDPFILGSDDLFETLKTWGS